jgi:transcriptional regulator with XRE-family HTH domain
MNGEQNEPLFSTFGEYMRYHRQIRKMSLEELAERIGRLVTPQALHNIENPTHIRKDGEAPRPRLRVVDAIADAFGLSRDEARWYAGYRAETPPDRMRIKHQELCSLFDRLPDEWQYDLLLMLATLAEKYRLQDARAEEEEVLEKIAPAVPLLAAPQSAAPVRSKRDKGSSSSR